MPARCQALEVQPEAPIVRLVVRLFNHVPALGPGFKLEKYREELVVNRDLASPLPFRRPIGLGHNIDHSPLEIDVPPYEAGRIKTASDRRLRRRFNQI